MAALADFEENDRAFTDDLIDDESWHDYQEDWAEGQNEVEFSSEDVLISIDQEEVKDLLGVCIFNLLLLQELALRHSKTMKWTI